MGFPCHGRVTRIDAGQAQRAGPAGAYPTARSSADRPHVAPCGSKHNLVRRPSPTGIGRLANIERLPISRFRSLLIGRITDGREENAIQETDIILRTLVDAALAERRSWKSVADLAWEAGVGVKLAYKALRRPTSIGAITKHSGGGFSVTDPERVLSMLSVRRSLAAAHHTTFEGAQSLLPELSAYAIGGTRAATHHLGGRNTVAEHAAAIVYVPDDTDLDRLPHGDGALVMVADERSLRAWTDGFTSKAQTYADLFAQPGWQASEFRRALWRQWFAVDDWAKAEESRG